MARNSKIATTVERAAASVSAFEELSSRERILRVAIEEFASRGYDGTVTRTIEQRAGVTMPTIYFHFGDKRGLYLECCKRVFSEVNNWTGAALVGDKPAPERVLDFVVAHFKALAEHPFLFRYYMRELAEDQSEVLPQILEQVTEGSVVTLHDVLEEATGRPVEWIEVVMLFGITSGVVQFAHWGGIIQRSIREELDKGERLPRMIVARLFPEIIPKLPPPSIKGTVRGSRAKTAERQRVRK